MTGKTLARWLGGAALAFLGAGAANAADCAGLKAKSTATMEITAATLHPGGAFTLPPGPRGRRPCPRSAGCREC